MVIRWRPTRNIRVICTKFLYLDASGDPGWPQPYGNSTTKFYVLFGIAVDTTEQLNKIKSSVSAVIKEYFPTKLPKELKYSWIVRGQKEFVSLTKKERKSFCDNIFKVIIDTMPVLFGVVIDKAAHRAKYNSPEDPQVFALRIILGRFTKYLERISDNGIIICDSESRNTVQKLRNAVSSFRKSGIVRMSYNSPYNSRNKLQKLIEEPLFQDSEVSAIIQLADFCAYALASKYEKLKDRRFNEIAHLFDKYDDRCYGLFIWPQNRETSEAVMQPQQTTEQSSHPI